MMLLSGTISAAFVGLLLVKQFRANPAFERKLQFK